MQLGWYFLTGIFERRRARSTERALLISGFEFFHYKGRHLPSFHLRKPLIEKVLAGMRQIMEMRSSYFPQNSFPQRNNGITMISANLWHDWPRRRRLSDRLEAFAQLAKSEGADVVLLQEVIHSPEICADNWLAHRLGITRVYTRANGYETAIRFEEGLAFHVA